MENSGRPSHISSQNHLFDLLLSSFPDATRAYDLFNEFLQQKTFSRDFCLRLLKVARQRTGASWEVRRLAVLMLENQILRLQTDNLDDFDFLLTQLNLKQGSGPRQRIVSLVLKEGYSTTELRRFLPEFHHKLARLNRVHNKIRGTSTPGEALRDFISLSRCDCKLSLARYLFSPEDIVEEILKHMQVTEGVMDLDPSQPEFIEDERSRAIKLLPAFEARILKGLCDSSNTYWVAESTSSEINSLVEYPATTVVLVIKPPGSDIEFEIKRAGRKGRNSLNVVYEREGEKVPPSHRLDAGNMRHLLRYEAEAASRIGVIYRQVHGTEAPITKYIGRATSSAVPVQGCEVQTLTYFTDREVFGEGFEEMRVAMQAAVAAFRAEDYPTLSDIPGDLGLSAQFIGVVAPTQAILSGTSSFRLEKLAAYLSDDGPNVYFKEGLKVDYSSHDSRQFAEAILEEVLGRHQPPDVCYQSHEQYVAAAFCVAQNRANANRLYSSLLQQAARFWGTLLAVRGYSDGESFVARNVGLRSFWDQGEWNVRITFMDHDALSIPGPLTRDFDPNGALPRMGLDERYLWGGSKPEHYCTSSIGYLRRIYRVSAEVAAEAQALARDVLKEAYKLTQRQLITNPHLRSLFSKEFLDRALVFDTLVSGYLRPDIVTSEVWKDDMKKMLAEKDYGPNSFDAYMEIIESNRQFLEKYLCLFESESKKES